MGIDRGTPKRFWAKHKVQVVLRPLRGEDIDLVSRDTSISTGKVYGLARVCLSGNCRVSPCIGTGSS